MLNGILNRKRCLSILSGVACAFVGMGIFAVNEGRACSPPQPSLGWISVAEGTTGLPTNLSIWVAAKTGAGNTPFEYKLTGPDGVVELADEKTGWARVSPKAPLKPATTYTLEVSCMENQCSDPKEIKKVSFTTGAGPWSAPAAYAGGTIATAKYLPKKTAQNSCESSADERFTVTVEGPKGEQAAYYKLYRVDAPGQSISQGEAPTLTVTLPFSEAGNNVCFYLRAVDHANLEETNTTQVCVTPKKDSTVISEPVTDGSTGFDGGTNHDNGTTGPNVRTGCSLQGTSGVPAIGAFLIFLILGGIRRARR